MWGYLDLLLMRNPSLSSSCTKSLKSKPITHHQHKGNKDGTTHSQTHYLVLSLYTSRRGCNNRHFLKWHCLPERHNMSPPREELIGAIEQQQFCNGKTKRKRKKDNSGVATSVIYGGASISSWSKSISIPKSGITRIREILMTTTSF